ncbi:MAG: class I SAM-dependent methyltransferase [Mangrovicoccus sp.]|nr:class I SAM-dependent methyltransferase [Mangrovicoccus sp.]
MSRHIIQEASAAPDGRKTAPAALRNTGPLIEALRARLPATGRVLELASGTGQHAAAFAAAFPALEWLPSDVDPGQRSSITAWRQDCGLANLAAPLAIDIAEPWPVAPGTAQAVLAINLLHLIPEPFLTPLFGEARQALGDGGKLLIYGPFLRGSSYASEGDQSFDAALRARDPAIGYKSVEAVTGAAQAAGFTPLASDAMPANNLLLSFAAPQ